MRNRVFLAALAALAVSSCAPSLPKMTIVIHGIPFNVEIARTQAEREKGLMFRKSLGAREGMIFVFDSDQHLAFWMKDTPLPLSIAFLSSGGKILEIHDMTPFSQETIRSRLSSRYALELPKGTFQDIGAVEGEIVELPQGFK